MRKYGVESFELSILATAQTLDELNELEVQYIQKLNTLVPNGYNLAPGGSVRMWHSESRAKIAVANSNRVFTEETKEKHRVNMTGNTHTKGMRGVFHHSEESKTRHSVASKARWVAMSQEDKNKLLVAAKAGREAAYARKKAAAL
jgi:hypothetical protein